MADPLKVEKLVILRVPHTEVARFVRDVYHGHTKYSFAEVEGCKPLSDHAFIVDGDIDEDDDADDIKLIRTGKEVPAYRNQLLLDVLCKDGCLEAGYYLVQVGA